MTQDEQQAAFSALLSLIFFLGFILLTVEAILIWNGAPPITSVVRAAAAAHPVPFVILGWTIGVLVGHLFWGTSSGSLAPTAKPISKWGSGWRR